MRRSDFLRLSAASLLGIAAPRALAGTRVRSLALVTADLEARVVAVDLSGGRVVAHIPTPAGPRSIETAGRGATAVVAHSDSGQVALLDVASLRVRQVLHDFGEPRYTAADPAGRYAYVTDARRGELVVVDVQRDRIAARVEVGALARHVTIDPTGRTVWLALGPKAPALAVVDVSNPLRPRLRRKLTPIDLAHDVGFSVDGALVVVTSGADHRIAIHDARSGLPLVRLPAGAPPQHVVLLPAVAYVTSGDSRTLNVHSLPSGRLLHTATVPDGSYNVTAGGGRIFTPSLDLGTLAIADRRGVVALTEHVAKQAHDACYVRSAAV